MPSRAIKVVAFLLAVLLLTGAVLIVWMVTPPSPRPATPPQPAAAPAAVPVPGPGVAQPARFNSPPLAATE